MGEESLVEGGGWERDSSKVGEYDGGLDRLSVSRSSVGSIEACLCEF